MHKYVDNFVSNLEGRMDIEKDRNKIFVPAGKLFDVSEIIKYETASCDIKENLEEYSRLAKRTGNLNRDMSIDDLLSEYYTFAKRVRILLRNISTILSKKCWRHLNCIRIAG